MSVAKNTNYIKANSRNIGSLLTRRIRALASSTTATVLRTLRKQSATDVDVEPLLSIIVPVYDVEQYVEQTLRSLLRIERISVEIIVVDDGSPDDSMLIVEGIAAEDARIRIHRQKNAGLGAARNKGISLSRGEYIAFIDSDDLVELNSLERAVETLEETGSDFAVGHYRHLVNGKLRPAGQWILDAHSDARSTELDAFPKILVNAIVCSKVFRRSFWTEKKLKFPVGVLFEDQEVSTLAYSRANRFDILTFPVIQWRRRESGDSITQQVADADNLRQRFASANKSLDILVRNGHRDAANARCLEYLANNTFTLAQIANGDDDYWSTLVECVPSLWNMVSYSDIRNRVSAPDKILYWLVLTGQREAAVAITRAGGRAASAWEIVSSSFGSEVRWPTPSIDFSVPDWCRALSTSETRIIGTYTNFRWESASSLRICGSAYISNLPVLPASALRVFLVDPTVGMRIGIPITRVHCEGERRRSGMRTIDYSNSGFDLSVDFAEVWEHMASENIKTSVLRLEFEIVQGGEVRSGFLKKRIRNGGMETIEAQYPLPDVFVRPRWNSATGLEFVVRKAPVVIGRVHADSTSNLSGDLQIGTKRFLPSKVLIRPANTLMPGVAAGEVQYVEGRPRLFLRLEDVDLDAVGKIAEVLVADASGIERVVHCDSVTISGQQGGSVIFDRSHTSRLLVRPIGEYFEIRSVTVSPDGNYLELVISSGLLDARLLCEVAGPLRTTIHSGRSVQDTTLFRIPLFVDSAVSGRKMPARAGLYQFTVSTLDGVGLRPTFESIRNLELPFDHQTELFDVQIRMSGHERIGFEIREKDLDLNGSQFIRELRIREYTESKPVLRDTVYLQCLQGDQANDNQLAVANELRKISPEIDIVWGVSSSGVEVPEGDRSVLIWSASYFDAISTAKVLCFNHEVPSHFVKHPGQVFIQTYHGHPFKAMGLTAWTNQNYTKGQLQRSLEKRAIWDYLLSPSPLASKLYRENFPLDYELIEMGHPRNDALIGVSEEQRVSLRNTIGIDGDKIGVLYAPTYRDNRSSNPWSSPIVDFFDPQELADQLGSDYVVLLRGHPANGRFAPKEKSEGQVIDVTLYPDVNHLIIAADIGVFDYSSIRFDFLVTGKPSIFFVPDKKEYFEFSPALLPFEESIAGPEVVTLSELVSEVHAVRKDSSRHREISTKMIETFAPQDDGDAGTRVASFILSQLLR